MREDELNEIAAKLDTEDYDTESRVTQRRVLYQSLVKEIRFHTSARFWQYAPTYSCAPDFTDRLTLWLTNPVVTSDGVKTMLNLVPHIQFVDRDDMLSLYRAAFTGPITRWLMDELRIGFSTNQVELDTSIKNGTETTWFCPVTDSMDIAQFHHINRIQGKSHRPTWRTLREFGSVDKIKSYMSTEGFKRLVLLEDFVGSGVQSRGPIRFVIDNLCPSISVLFVPLIITERGCNVLKRLRRRSNAFQIDPVFVVPGHVNLSVEEQEFEPPLYPRLRELVEQTFDSVRQPLPPEVEVLQHSLGFNKLGAMVVLFSNCPNNTLPLIWHDSPEWAALFPRVSRGS